MLKNLKRRWQREEREDGWDEMSLSDDDEQPGQSTISRASTSTPARDTLLPVDEARMHMHGPAAKRRKTSTRPSTPVPKEAIGARLPEVLDTNRALTDIEDAKIIDNQCNEEDKEERKMALIERIKEENSM